MERQTIKKPLKGSSYNIPKDTYPLHYMGRPFEQQKNTLKDASFSSYLRPEPPPPPKPQDTNKFTVDDSDQISVFEAENYFSEKDQNNIINYKRDSSSPTNHHDHKTAQQRGCEFPTISRLSSVSSTDRYGYGGKLRARSFHATPTASSEASWNSQTGLLSNPQGSIPISLRNIPCDANTNNKNNTRRNGGYSSNGAKWFLGLKCPCYGKNSVQVEENLSEPKTPSLYAKRLNSPKSTDHRPIAADNRFLQSQNNSVTKKAEDQNDNPEQQLVLDYHFASHEGHQQHRRRPHQGVGSFRDSVSGFSFPILNNQKTLSASRCLAEEPPRESLEVFQPPEECMEVLDGGSDASSDLFEIDSFSTAATSYRRRDSLDDEARVSCGRRQSVDTEPASTECYEPSEASINWSVTTAEGFDRGSVTNFSVSASEFGDVTDLRRQEAEVAAGGGWSSRRRSGGGGGNNGGGLLLSCRWEKAVSVGPTQQQGKWGLEDGGGGGGGGRRVAGGGGGGPSMPMISTTRHVSSRPYKR